jgi:hypothetical protein
MSESEQKEPKVIVARKYETADEFLARRKKEDAERKKQEAIERRKQTRKLRLPEYTPYSNSSSKTKSKLLSRDQEFALSGINEMNNRKEILDVKNMLDITPSKQVPEGVNPFLPTPMELGLNRSEEKEDVISTNPVALDFDVEEELDFDELDTNEELLPNIKRIGGIKRRKSRKLRKSSKKSRKSKRKTTRKVRRHRRRH